MDSPEISKNLQILFARIFNQPEILIHRDLNADMVPKWDSLTHLSMIAEVESVFQIKFKLKELVTLKNVGDLIDLIQIKTQS